MVEITHYKITVLAAVVVLSIIAGAISAFGTSTQTAVYLAFVSPTVVALLALLRSEQNAKENAVRHAENRADIAAIRDGQSELAHDALTTLRESHLSIDDAALIASQILHQQEQKQSNR